MTGRLIIDRVPESDEVRPAWVRWDARTAEPIDTTAKYGVAREAFSAGYEAAAEFRDQRIKELERVSEAAMAFMWLFQNTDRHANREKVHTDEGVIKLVSLIAALKLAASPATSNGEDPGDRPIDRERVP